jgi:hypothetical protein
MKVILSAILIWVYALKRIATRPLEHFNNFNLNVNDQLAINIPQIFGHRPQSTAVYTVLDKAVKVVSTNAMQITEFNTNCKTLTPKFTIPEVVGNKFTTICGNTEFYELDVDDSTGKITGSRLLYSAKAYNPTTQCMASGYMKSKNVYLLFCNYTANANTYFLGLTINPDTQKLLGQAQMDVTVLGSYKFEERIKVRAYPINKGSLMYGEAFFVWDEPYPDLTAVLTELKPKANTFTLIIDVHPTDGNPVNMQALRINQAGSGMEGQAASYMRVMSYEVLSQQMWIVLQDVSRIIRFWRCNINTNAANGLKLDSCSVYRHNIQLSSGTITFMNSGGGTAFIAYNDKPRNYTAICNFNIANTTDVAEKCRKMIPRTEVDLDIVDFRVASGTVVIATYMNWARTRYLGMDRFDLTDTSITIVNPSDYFKTSSMEIAEINKKYYIISDSFIEVYDNMRVQEMLLEARVLNADQRFSFDIVSVHEGFRDMKYINGTRVSKFIGPVQRTFAFPNFVGFLKNLHRMPVSRYFFSGNAIKYDIVAPSLEKYVLNAEDTILLRGGQPFKPYAYFHSYGISSFMVTKSQFNYGVCIKKVGSGTITLECDVLQGLTFDAALNEMVIAQYENHQILVTVTSMGKIIRYAKVEDTPQYTSMNMKTLSASFKVFGPYIQIAALVVDNTGKSEIKIIECTLDKSMTLTPKGSITKYTAGAGQDTAGEFCPRAVSYEIEDETNLVVLNSCPTKDRRLVRFDLKFPATPTQISNMFIKIPEFKQENLQMCTDSEVMIVAAPGTKKALGLGYFSYNTIMDLGLDDPNVGVKEIYKLICLGDIAFALAFYDYNDNFKVGVYYTRKYITASNRLHSIVDFPIQSVNRNSIQDVVGSEGLKLVVINVITKSEATFRKTINLNGPELFILSDRRTNVYDAEVRTSNNNVNENFNLVLNFVAQQNAVTASGRSKGIALNRQTYDLEVVTAFDGPIFNMALEIPDNPVISLTQRIGNPEDWLDPASAPSTGWAYASQAVECDGFILTLVQKFDTSIINFKDLANRARTWDVVLPRRCMNLAARSRSSSSIATVLSCYDKSAMKFAYFEISNSDSASEKIITTRYSNVTERSTQLAFVSSQNNDVYIMGNVNEYLNLTVYRFDVSKKIDEVGTTLFHHIWNATNGKF